ncbi:MAG: agmatinase [Acidimicrobiia bacterium]|nr:agmatinase [Acidimicrobiia bacterium]
MTARDAYHAYSSPGTFCGVPAAGLDDLGEAVAAIVGAPFDWGTTARPGARFGPKAIRENDYLGQDGSRPHLDSGIDALLELGVVDVGDVKMPPGYIEEGLDRITDVVERIARAGVVPIVLGGDHSVTFANATGVARVRGDGTFALVHFDAHADTGEMHYGMLHGHGTPMRRLIESGAVPGHRFVQIGLRGYWPPPDVLAWMREQQMRAFPMRDIVDRGLETVVDEAVTLASAGADGVFLSIDIDVVDPSAAPATGTPEPGGLTARELLDTVNRLGRELDIVGADIVEVSPIYDGPGEITSRLANRVILELLDGMARRRR